MLCSFPFTHIRTHPSEVAHGLEVDEVALARVQGSVPVAVVGVVVPHGEGAGLRQAAGGQLRRVVVRRPPRLGLGVRHGQRETLLQPQLPLHLLHALLLHHHLVGAAGRRGGGAQQVSAPVFPGTQSGSLADTGVFDGDG